MSKIIGLTGCIASGKSFVSTYLKNNNFTIIDCDNIVNNLYKSETFVIKIVDLFGQKVLINDCFSKQKLSDLVFSNKDELQKLNSLTFPLILEILKYEIEKNNNKDIIFVDAPILVESNLYEYIDFDEILLISTSKALQIERLKERNGLSHEDCLKRIDSQLSYDEKYSKLMNKYKTSDKIYRLKNVSTKEDLIEEIDNYLIKSGYKKQNQKKTVVYAGSFDPITYGHIDIIKKAARDFDEVIIGVLINESKTPMLSVSIRKKMIENMIIKENLTNVKVYDFNGLLIDFMRLHHSNILIRGLRTSEDFIYEQRNYLVNKDLDENIETHYFMSNPDYIHVSSSLVRTLLKQNFNNKYLCLEKYLPKYLIQYLK